MSGKQREIAPDWYTRAFDELYPILYAHRTVEAARPEALFAARVLGLERSWHVLDLCCGNGRHMKHLRPMCAHLSGLDYSPELLHHARTMLGAGCSLVRADMRAIPFQDCFDAVTNFFTSFGYFLNEEDNLIVVNGLASTLKRGGRFFIDYVNKENAVATLVPESLRSCEEYEICDKRWFDGRRKRLNKRTTITQDGTPLRVIEESVRLYEPGEFERLLAGSGLHTEAMYGDYAGSGLDSSVPRMIAVGMKEC